VYRITVEQIEGPGAPKEPLVFEAASHDDMLMVVEKSAGLGLAEGTATGFAVGLKLLGQALLSNRGLPLFQDFAPQFGAFMQGLKRGAGR
jgi:hypothetical protein